MKAAGITNHQATRITKGARMTAPKIPRLSSELPKINKPTTNIINERIISTTFVLSLLTIPRCHVLIAHSLELKCLLIIIITPHAKNITQLSICHFD